MLFCLTGSGILGQMTVAVAATPFPPQPGSRTPESSPVAPQPMTAPPVASPPQPTTADFWPQAQRLTQDQLYLVDRIEQALSQPDANRVKAVRGQLTLQTIAIERFLRRYSPQPRSLCAPSPAKADSALDSDQLQAYCNLYTSMNQLMPLGDILDRRLVTMNPGSKPSPALATTMGYRAVTFPLNSNPPVENSPAPESPLLGRTAKLATTSSPPVIPAVAPPAEALAALQTTRSRLQTSESYLPVSARINIPNRDRRNPLELYPQEAQPYSQFLTLPATGIARLLPDTAYIPGAGQGQNRLEPTLAEQLPFATLEAQDKPGEFTPHLSLRVVDGKFQLAQPGLDYGLIVNLGDVPLEDLGMKPARSRTTPAAVVNFLYTYQPPAQLEAVQVDRRQFTAGKIPSLPGQTTALTQVEAALNQTYLVRSLQFQVPEVIASGRLLEPRERRFLNQLLEMPARDLLIAFRPVNRRPDGSYTVLWRIVHRFPDPQVRDLERYVQD